MKALFGLTLALAILASAPAGVASQVGTVSFPNSGAEEAQTAFLRGLALLHNFEYGTAGAAFREAQESDPDFAMAYWGEAMTYNHPIWLEQDSTRARETLERLGPDAEARAAKAGTEREGDYLAALEVLYGSGTKEERDFAYRDAMRGVYEKWPGDPEAATFYALSILGTAHSGRDFATYMQAAAIVEEVFDENPDHPGAAHYLIHSYDDPLHAPLGLRAALAYSAIAPDAAHAQHMTSHIFVAMGMWDAVVAANENARQVSRGAVEARGGTPRGCGHYNFWLEYGYLQQGRADEAKTLLRECFETAGGSDAMRRGDILDPDNSSRGSYAGMLARYVLDTEQWDDESLRWTLPFDDLFPARMTWTFINGYAAAKRGELVTTEVSREALAETRSELDTYLAGTPSGGDASLGDSYRTRARILEMELEALLAAARGNEEAALAVAAEAADLEATMPVFFGPPMVDKPAGELLAELLLEFGRGEDAARAFEAQLERTPERLTSVRGLAKATALAANRRDPQAERDAVLAAAQAVFDAIGSGDAELGAAVLTENATFTGTTETPDGVTHNAMGRDAFLEMIQGRTDMLERMWEPTVMVHGTVAVVWTRYDFHIGGEFSHCGVDAFNLVRNDEGWRVASIVWTVERTGCAPSPLGPPR
jgi:tetratricopeptide (TPR) repeat protein